MRNRDSGKRQPSTRTVMDSLRGRFFQGQIPKVWRDLLGILDEAHLPHTLPIQWQNTEGKHQMMAYNPETKQLYSLSKEVFVKCDSNPVHFINLSPGQAPMPGSNAPAAVRSQLYGELSSHIIRDEAGNYLGPCLAHGDYVKVESLQGDHLQAKAKIRERQQEIVHMLNEDSEFADFLMAQPGMDKFFIQVDGVYYGTLFFYELYFNDIDNVWLICQACNSAKSDQEYLDWFQGQWLYGEEFVQYLSRENIKEHSPILTKINGNKGLARVAIDWFWDRHASYVAISKKFLEEVKVPLFILGRRLDYIIGTGNEQRAARHEALVNFKVSMLSEIVKTPGLGMPREAAEIEHSSSDSDDRLKIGTGVSRSVYDEATQEVVSELSQQVQAQLTAKILSKTQKRS